MDREPLRRGLDAGARIAIEKMTQVAHRNRAVRIGVNEQSTIVQVDLEDPALISALLRTHLRPADGATLDIRSCEINYVRHSSTRSVVQYSLQVAHGDPETVSSQIVTAVTYGAERTRAQWDQALEADPTAHRSVGPLGIPAVTFISDHELIVQAYPYDYRLPGLIRVVEGTPELVAILFADADEGNWLVETWDANVVRYRPDMRAMVRVDLAARRVDDGKHAHRRSYAKVYRINDQGQQAFRLLQALVQQSAIANGAFSVAHPIEYIETWQTLLVREAPGDRLLQLVRRGDHAEALAAVRRAARAVAALHQVSLPDDLLPPPRKEKHDQLVDVTGRMARQNPAQAPAIDRLVSHICQALAEDVSAPTHFDLKLGHLLMAGQQVTILDFDKMALGDPLVDVANIVATLDAERERSRARGTLRSELADGFVQEYFAHVPESWRERFAAQYAQAALVEAGTTGRGQRGRPGQSVRAGWLAAAIEQAERALNGDRW